MKHFILMADVQDSRKKDSTALLRKFRDLTVELNEKNKEHIVSPLTITLGDEFQGIVDNLANSVQLIFDAEELMIKHNYDFKLRYVLNYGEIDTPVNTEIAYGMLGPGLTDARETLNETKKTDARFAFSVPDEKQNEQLNNSFIVYQNLVDDWKNKDYTIVREFIENKSYREVSEIVHMHLSSAWRREKSLHIKPYFAIKDVISSLTEIE